MRSRVFSVLVRLSYFVVLASLVSCGDGDRPSGTPTAPTPPPTISDDATVWRLMTQTEPFASYTVFPNTEEFTTGTLNGSEAHRTIVRVTLNARAAGALQNGKLPSGARFPDGSIIFKELRPSTGASATGYAVMYKHSSNALAGNGWLWAQFSPSGDVGYSISNRGGMCTGCHQLEQGPQNDSVRTFERQR
jgi:cytochrome P460